MLSQFFSLPNKNLQMQFEKISLKKLASDVTSRFPDVTSYVKLRRSLDKLLARLPLCGTRRPAAELLGNCCFGFNYNKHRESTTATPADHGTCCYYARSRRPHRRPL